MVRCVCHLGAMQRKTARNKEAGVPISKAPCPPVAEISVPELGGRGTIATGLAREDRQLWTWTVPN